MFAVYKTTGLNDILDHTNVKKVGSSTWGGALTANDDDTSYVGGDDPYTWEMIRDSYSVWADAVPPDEGIVDRITVNVWVRKDDTPASLSTFYYNITMGSVPYFASGDIYPDTFTYKNYPATVKAGESWVTPGEAGWGSELPAGTTIADLSLNVDYCWILIYTDNGYSDEDGAVPRLGYVEIVIEYHLPPTVTVGEYAGPHKLDVVTLQAVRNVEMMSQGAVFVDRAGSLTYEARTARP
jgi:hypothetical protein